MSDDTGPTPAKPKPEKPKRPQQVFTLVVEVGRKVGDGLPDKATGAALMIYASGVDEDEAVRETVVILKQADMAPLDVSGSARWTNRSPMVTTLTQTNAR